MTAGDGAVLAGRGAPVTGVSGRIAVAAARAAGPEEGTEAAARLCGGRAGLVAAATLTVDGGRTAW
ncbi:hypothetical protein ACFWPQ_19800 [Streptomyces sp. NPDC058464]|uniref:hypothetical protein n=1 Tax=Streptomyces sp. NPDC058464 TaxID=3346511 RepID=UPI0036610A81